MNLLQQYQTYLQLQNIPGYLKGSDLNGFVSPKRSDPSGPNEKVKSNKPNLFEKSNICQQQNAQRQTESNGYSSIDIQNIGPFNIFHNLNQNAINNETIAKTKSLVNITNFFVPVSLEKLGTINTAPNQPADKLINKSEITDDQTELININNNLT